LNVSSHSLAMRFWTNYYKSQSVTYKMGVITLQHLKDSWDIYMKYNIIM
jgi:hypothetical protein